MTSGGAEAVITASSAASEGSGAPSGGRDLREGGAWTPAQRLKNDILYAAARVALGIAARLPRAVVRGACISIALVIYACARTLRARVRAALAAGLGSVPPDRRVRRAFAHAGTLLADTLALLDPEERATRTLRLTPASREAFGAALACGRGVVFVTAHLGPWERMAAVLAAEGFPVATVARESYDPRFTRYYERLRAPRGVRCLWRGRAGVGKGIVRELRRGRAVGFLIDLPGRSPAVDCPLFGEVRRVADGAARLALSLGAQVVLGTPIPAASGGYEVLVERLEPPPRASADECTRFFAAALTRRIEAQPESWAGLYARAPDHVAVR